MVRVYFIIYTEANKDVILNCVCLHVNELFWNYEIDIEKIWYVVTNIVV